MVIFESLEKAIFKLSKFARAHPRCKGGSIKRCVDPSGDFSSGWNEKRSGRSCVRIGPDRGDRPVGAPTSSDLGVVLA